MNSRRRILQFLCLGSLFATAGGIMTVNQARAAKGMGRLTPSFVGDEWVGEFDASDPLYRSALLARRMSKCMSIRAEIDKIDQQITTYMGDRGIKDEVLTVSSRLAAYHPLHWPELVRLHQARWNYERQIAELQRLPVMPVKRDSSPMSRRS